MPDGFMQSLKPTPLEWLLTSREKENGAVNDSAILFYRINQAILDRLVGSEGRSVFLNLVTNKAVT